MFPQLKSHAKFSVLLRKNLKDLTVPLNSIRRWFVCCLKDLTWRDLRHFHCFTVIGFFDRRINHPALSLQCLKVECFTGKRSSLSSTSTQELELLLQRVGETKVVFTKLGQF